MKRQKTLKRLEEDFEYFVQDSRDIFILFADLCGSTEFKQNCNTHGFPEITWIGRQLLFLQRVAEHVNNYEGDVIKTVGDELIATFRVTTPPEIVLKCAIEIIQGFGNYKPYQGKSRLEAKVSIDFGPTYNGSLTDTGPYDPIGTPVDRCSRLNDVTKKNEITFSDDFLSAMLTTFTDDWLKGKYNYQTREENLKGLGNTIVHSILLN
jgi:class 3 adenylate cyclase